MTGEELWAVVRIIGMAITGVGMIVAVRRRPGAPPNSPMVRWSVAGCVTATVALIAFMFWLGVRQAGR